MPTPKTTRPKPTTLTYGYQPDGTWHFGDCTIGTDGEVHPEPHDIPGLPAPRLLIPKPADIEARHAGEVLRLFTDLLTRSIGAAEAQRVIGFACSYVAAPYLLMHGHGHPGLWLHGKMGAGKTITARWLLALYGIGRNEAVNVAHHGTTYAGMARSLRQVCCLPVIFDEYRPGRATMDKEAVLRGAFDRDARFTVAPAAKGAVHQDQPLTVPIVCGEAPSHDAATRSRYYHVDFTLANRLSGGDFNGMNSILVRQLHLIGMALLKRHADFGGFVVDEVRALVPPKETDVVLNHRAAYVAALGDICFKAIHRIIY